MKKIIIIICTVFLLSGCTVDYNITIKDNGTVTEESTMSGQKVKNNEEFENVKESIKSQFEHIYDKYGYKYSITNSDNIVVFKINRNSKITTLFESSLYHNFYEDYELFDSDNKKIFKSVGSNYISSLFEVKNYDEDLAFEKKIDELRLNITFENKVLSHNADEVDEKNNTYTWIFNKNNYKKGIEFSYDMNEQIRTINNENNNKKSKDKIKIDVDIIYIFATAFVVAIVVIIGILIMLRRFSSVNKM